MMKRTPAQKRKAAKRMLEKKLPANPKVKADDTVLTASEMRRLINTL